MAGNGSLPSGVLTLRWPLAPRPGGEVGAGQSPGHPPVQAPTEQARWTRKGQLSQHDAFVEPAPE